MPAVSGNQYRKMAATLGGAKTGVPYAVAKEMVLATTKQKRSLWSKKKARGLFGRGMK